MTRGVYFAITDEQKNALDSLKSPEERYTYVIEEIEEKWEKDFLVQTDKAWDAMHRSLSEFPPDTPAMWPGDEPWALPDAHGSYPLKITVLGGKQLADPESDFFLRMIEAAELPDLVEALNKIDEAEMRDRYFKHCKGA